MQSIEKVATALPDCMHVELRYLLWVLCAQLCCALMLLRRCRSKLTRCFEDNGWRQYSLSCACLTVNGIWQCIVGVYSFRPPSAPGLVTEYPYDVDCGSTQLQAVTTEPVSFDRVSQVLAGLAQQVTRPTGPGQQFGPCRPWSYADDVTKHVSFTGVKYYEVVRGARLVPCYF